MNIIWLYRNLATSWRHRARLFDAIKRMRWIYSKKFSWILPQVEQVIGFRYADPIGELHLLVRANAGSDSFIFSEVFDHEYYKIPLPSVPHTILDLGANAGFTACYFSRIYPNAHIACVEPVQDNIRVLTRNLDLNNIRAEIIPAAIAVKDGSVTMEIGAMDYGHKVVEGIGVEPEQSIEVQAFTIPTILQQLGWERVGLIKIDIEGYEKTLFATNCDWLQLVDAMCIECHEGFGEPDLIKLAERFGFMPPRLLPGIWLMTRS